MPIIGFHSIIERPESVRRVMPPNSTMTITIKQHVSSHRPTACRLLHLRFSEIMTLLARECFIRSSLRRWEHNELKLKGKRLLDTESPNYRLRRYFSGNNSDTGTRFRAVPFVIITTLSGAKSVSISRQIPHGETTFGSVCSSFGRG